MKVSDAVKRLQELDQESHLIMAWWDSSAFDILPDDWETFSEYVEYQKDWSGDHDDITDMYNNWVKGW